MTVIELDARRRLSFGKVGRKEDTRYIVEERSDGSLILTPAAVVPVAMARLIERLQVGVDDIHAGRVVSIDDTIRELGLDAGLNE